MDENNELTWLMAGVWAAPSNRTGWLVLADWLEEQGDERGAWLRADVTSQDSEGEAALLKWIGPLGPGWRATRHSEPPGVLLESERGETWSEGIVAAAEGGWATLDLGSDALERCAVHAPRTRALRLRGWEVDSIQMHTFQRVVTLGRIRTEPLLRFSSLARLELLQERASEVALGGIIDFDFTETLSGEDLQRVGSLASLRALKITGVSDPAMWTAALSGLRELSELSIRGAQ